MTHEYLTGPLPRKEARLDLGESRHRVVGGCLRDPARRLVGVWRGGWVAAALREYGRVHSAFWTSADGRQYAIPSPVTRLKFRYPSHAALRAHVFTRDRFTCQRCGWKPQSVPEDYNGRYTIIGPDIEGKRRELQLDHVTPFIRGGTHHPSNLRTLCFGCNAAKRDREAAA